MSQKQPDPFSLLLTEEQRIIEKTRKLREELIDNFIKEKGHTTRTGEMRVLNEMMNSLDSNVMDVVDKRLKVEENKNTEDLTDTIRQVFLQVENKTNLEDLPNKIVEVEDKIIPEDLVPGEDIIEYEELDPEDYIDKKDVK